MKKIVLALVASMLVLGMTQCKKEQQNKIIPDEGETVYITMKVADEGGKHIVYPGTGAVIYGDGDKIYVGNNGHYVGTLTYANGAFSGSITSPSTSDYLHFYFTGGKTPETAPTAGSTESFTVNIADQSSNLPVLSYGHSTTKYIDGTTAYTCILENKCGLVKFVPSEATTNLITVSGMKTTATINFATPGITPNDATGKMKLYSINASEKWAILLPQNQVTNPVVSIDGYTSVVVSVPVVTPNTYLPTGLGISMYATPTGALDALFTINADGDKVWFSQGNLKYSNGVWSFHTNQWDRCFTTDCDVSADYTASGTFDLFGWGTSGYSHGAVCCKPWSTSITHSDYYVYGSPTYNLYDQTGMADWGYNKISNGGNTVNQWRTLTVEEWDYVLNSRVTASGIRRTRGTVNGVQGLILVPDNWRQPEYSLYADPNNFEANNISLYNWNTYFKPQGVVFLPVTGYRSATDFYMIENYNEQRGYYWSSSYNTQDWMYRAYPLRIEKGRISVQWDIERFLGHAVRLVQDVPNNKK